MNIPAVFWLVPVASIVALGMAYVFFRQMMAADEGTPRMKEIALYVRNGAMAYLKQQYKVVCIVFVVLCALFAFMAYGLNVQNPWVPFAFLTGGFFSGLAGFFGMKTATYASARTANAARESLNAGLKIAFRSGAVMGLTVVGLGLLDIAIWFVVLNHFDQDGLISITTTMLTFGMGASTQALFARVGGGIYTKAADVGADIVGKVEADIPEDDPRNPATIADNVGDNVGDVAGMGADLYESYCGSVLSTAALGAAAFGVAGLDIQLKAVIAPMLIAAVGVFLSLLGIFLVRTKEGATMKDLLHSLSVGTNVSARCAHCLCFVRHPLSAGHRQLARSFLLCHLWSGCRCYHRTGHRILYVSLLQAHTEDLGSRTNRCSYRDYQGYWYRNDLYLYPCHHDWRSHHAQLPLCQWFRPLVVVRLSFSWSLWHRYCCCRHALYAGYHTGY